MSYSVLKIQYINYVTFKLKRTLLCIEMTFYVENPSNSHVYYSFFDNVIELRFKDHLINMAITMAIAKVRIIS